MNKIVIFASGEGTNAEWIFRYFRNHPSIKVVSLFCNNSDAPVIRRAFNHHIPVRVFNKKDFYETDAILNELIELDVDLIVLAGFLWLVPEKMIEQFPLKIVNIHPALLPKYGGKGMYGAKVFAEIIKYREKMSGITIHYVNKQFDEGEIIYQAMCRIDKGETPESLAEKTHRLEYHYYPVTIEKVIMEQNQIKSLL
jgi:phosphoribosylglycinamide formyltransferase-1